MRGAGDFWRRITRQVLDQARATGQEKNTVSGVDEVSECESMDWEPTSKQSVVVKKTVKFKRFYRAIRGDMGLGPAKEDKL